MAKITDRQARAIKPGDKAIAGGITGLWLRPGTTPGNGKWVLRFVSPVTGKRRDMGLGNFPDTTVAKALATAQAAREQIAEGGDPINERRALTEIPTFLVAARTRWKEVAPSFRNEKHIAQWINTLDQHVFPHIGHIRVDRLDPKAFADVLGPIWLTTPVTAKRVKQRCSDVMAWCWAHGFVSGNPLDVVDRLLATQPTRIHHHPAMPWAKVGPFVQKQLTSEPTPGVNAALLFLILTAARSGEVRGTTWSEIDFDKRRWTIPGDRMKAEVLHRVPLSDAAITLLEQQKALGLHKELVFPSPRKKVLSDMSFTQLLRRANAVSDVPGRVATAHGFRSSFRDWAADEGYPSDIAERALAHTIGNKTQAAYERTDRLAARRDMMQKWADLIFSDQSNVVRLKRAAG